MFRFLCFLPAAFLASGFGIPAAIRAAEPHVADQAGFFSKPAIEQADLDLQEIKRRFKVELVIETFPSIPENLKAAYKPQEKQQFFQRWAETRATSEGFKGIYVLVCKNPGRLQIVLDQAVRKKAFTRDDRDELVKSAVKLMASKQYDAALTEIVDTIESTLLFKP